MYEKIGAAIVRNRNKKGISQAHLAELLTREGFDISFGAVSKWERGLSYPNAPQLFTLCSILNINDPLWEFAGVHRGPFSGLNEAGREKAKELVDLLFHIDKYRDEPEYYSEGTPRLLPLYDIPVSAGTGSFLEDSDYEMIEVPGYVPQSATYALRISGDSMEPLYQDKQIIWVREQPALDSGEIGVFYYDDHSYCKKYIDSPEGVFLHSINDSYDDIQIDMEIVFQVLGKVVA